MSLRWDNIFTLWQNGQQVYIETLTCSLIFFSNLRNRRNRPDSKYDMPIRNCQAIKNALQIASLTLVFNTLGRARPTKADGHGFQRGLSKHSSDRQSASTLHISYLTYNSFDMISSFDSLNSDCRSVPSIPQI